MGQAISPSKMHPVNVCMLVCLSVLVISFSEASGNQEDCKGTWKNGMCIDASSRKRRSCENFENGECQDVKRRSTCDGVMENGVCKRKTTDRKRRSTCDGVMVNGVCKTADRKRRSSCDGVMVNGVCNPADRKRRSNDDNDCKKWVNGRCIDPSSSRKRRATPTPDVELCVIDEDNDDSDDVC